VIIRDITARRETEEALKRTQESFQSAIENLNDGFALFDSDFRLVYANDEYKKLHHHVADIIVAGVSAEELVRTTVKRGVIAAAKGREEEFVRERLDQYANPSNEPIIRTYESGITLSLRESRTPEGGFVTSQTNITKQVRAEKILRDAVESLPNGFALFDKDDRLVLCNQNYIDEHPEIADILIIGTTFEEQIRLREEKGLRQSQVDGKRISLEERIERHHNPRGPMIVPIADGRVHQLQEVKTIDGGTALIRTDITSLIKAEEALRENEELYRTLVNFSPNAIYFHQDNTIVFANPAAVKIFGAKSADEIIGTSNLRHVPEGLEEIVEKRIKRILATGESVVIDQKYVQIDGTVIDVEAQGTVISYRGQPAVMVIARDISERKKAEEALRRNEERFRGGIEALQEGFALFDNNDRLIIFNEEYKRLHPIVADMLEPGVRYEDLLRANVAAGLNVKANGREEEYIRERLELHRNPQGPLVRELIDGTWYIINESRTREGGTVEVQTDITELKKTQADLQNAHDDLEHRVEERTRNLRHEVAERQRTEEALRQSEARVAEAHSRLIDAIESFKDGLLLFDKNDCLILSNEAYRQSALDIADILSTGLTFEKLLRTRIERAVLEIGQKPVTEVWIEQRIEQHQNPTVPIERVTSDGRHFQLQEFKTQEGGTLIIRRDITEQRIVEQALMQAKSEADSANQAKSDFLSSMSHELRTPMNAILGFSQLLQSTPNAPLKEKQSQYVDHILQSGEHLLDLINQVLDFAKIESGTTNLVFQDTQLRDVITDCLALIETRAGERNIQVKDETKGIVFDAIWTDQTRLKQVLLNLLSNAVKYNQPSGRVSIRCVQRANNMLRVSVEDTGRGIPENLQAEVFQPFNRLGAEASKIEGTGIGLTITKQLIDQLGGDIGFESTVGEGSTFWVDLPLENDDIKETLSEKNKEIGE
jgi:PAS domain S-box-containing protein